MAPAEPEILRQTKLPEESPSPSRGRCPNSEQPPPGLSKLSNCDGSVRDVQIRLQQSQSRSQSRNRTRTRAGTRARTRAGTGHEPQATGTADDASVEQQLCRTRCSMSPGSRCSATEDARKSWHGDDRPVFGTGPGFRRVTLARRCTSSFSAAWRCCDGWTTNPSRTWSRRLLWRDGAASGGDSRRCARCRPGGSVRAYEERLVGGCRGAPGA